MKKKLFKIYRLFNGKMKHISLFKIPRRIHYEI